MKPPAILILLPATLRAAEPIPNHIFGHGHAFIIAAKFGAAFPDAKLEFFNRGISGNTMLDLEKR